MNTSNLATASEETTGRFLVLLDKNKIHDGVQAIRQQIGLDQANIASTADEPEGALSREQSERADIIILEKLGIALINQTLDIQQENALASGCIDDNVPIFDMTPDAIWYAIQDEKDYLQGYRDGVNQLIDNLLGKQTDSESLAVAAAVNESANTWGLQATQVVGSTLSGKGIRVAVLDTGMDLNHPDFIGRTIVSKSFATLVDNNRKRITLPVDDLSGHGTHCIGTACGPRNPRSLPRYGVAYESEIYVGKVLRDRDLNGVRRSVASGTVFEIVQGIEWAVANNCQVISMSIGGPAGASFNPSYENIGRRALEQGCLIIAAAGNDSKRDQGIIKPVNQPANSPSIMAVAAVDAQIRITNFSCAGTSVNGGQIDIAGPGVDVRSSYPTQFTSNFPSRVPPPIGYTLMSGTSMATPHVAGIAALWSQKTGKRGQELWTLLTQNALRLNLPSSDVGSGLVQAPHPH